MEKPQCTGCKFCNLLTPEQKAQLATPTYKLKKEKRESKKLESDPSTLLNGQCAFTLSLPCGPCLRAANRGCGWPGDTAVPWFS